jgi:hypothetical protein
MSLVCFGGSDPTQHDVCPVNTFAVVPRTTCRFVSVHTEVHLQTLVLSLPAHTIALQHIAHLGLPMVGK